MTAKKRFLDKKAAAFCQSLTKQLGRETAKAERSPMLEIAREIRQKILGLVLEDWEVAHADLDALCGKLSLVCKTFMVDMVWVLQEWKQRRAELVVVPRGAIDTYMNDLLGPLREARFAQELSKRAGMRNKAGKGRVARQNTERRVRNKYEGMLSHLPYDMRHTPYFRDPNQWTHPEVASETEKWRQLRQEGLERINAARKVEKKTGKAYEAAKQRRKEENKANEKRKRQQAQDDAEAAQQPKQIAKSGRAYKKWLATKRTHIKFDD
jgi:hypothetical protein